MGTSRDSLIEQNLELIGQVQLLKEQLKQEQDKNKRLEKIYNNMKQTLGYYYYSFLKDKIIKQGSYDYTRLNNLLEE